MIINIVLSIFLIGGIYFISQIVEDYIDRDLLKFKKYLNIKNNYVKMVNIGTSHGMYGLFYQKTDYTKMNLARSAQSFYYDLQLLKKYNKKIKKDAVIIIPVSILSFYSEGREDINQNYIPLLEKNDIIGVGFKNYYLTKNFSVLYPVSNLSKIIENWKKLKNTEGQIVYPENLELLKKKETSEKTALQHLGIFPKYYAIKNSTKSFINLINYIEKNNWKYILITTPFLYFYNENIEKYQKNAFKERIYDNVEEIERILNKKFIYLDYSHDERFENNLEYFIDGDHLNEKGAKYFTEILLEDLKKLGYNID